ncbi:hypothetical protein BKA61DRAFT_593682 [Leptodontidium sp. MPI-SDFR-AT-0119]|nr:hypothetical protein BKA61DRAFT_593682 [Leptodontidium sp. MPI-SDFR-AT-0119]
MRPACRWKPLVRLDGYGRETRTHTQAAQGEKTKKGRQRNNNFFLQMQNSHWAGGRYLEGIRRALWAHCFLLIIFAAAGLDKVLARTLAVKLRILYPTSEHGSCSLEAEAHKSMPARRIHPKWDIIYCSSPPSKDVRRIEPRIRRIAKSE